MIRIKNLTVAYQNFNGKLTALDRVNLEVKKGESCAIIGPSGCGKTTLLYVLSGLVSYSGGKVLINSEPVRAKRKKTALILQDYGLLPWKTVWDNTVLGLSIRRFSTSSQKEKVSEILKRLDLYEFRNYYPGQLSGGMRQRVAIARALTLEPDLFLMDEPFSALDAITREELQDLLLSIWQETPATILLVTHSIEEAVYLGQRVIVFSPGPGKIVANINNPYFGDIMLKRRPEFYRLCNQVRSLLEGGKDHEIKKRKV
ncbi:MAG: ABC transporter ATP-binding protein [Candidatus Syntrophonatronum acetioxidans]|uniref:ABC transporter ATP-binding protein n=1 Tax=Candidatus Syntrophonatronum acetioxidans TaxID=1795816 RepID=A0A424YEH9_9FIRM|nr:MAG: ABC transporter ATP-binding protein [Candidatus Syntrophonatronum acetioxidans]